MSQLKEVLALCPNCSSVVAKRGHCCDGFQTQPIYDEVITEIEKQPGVIDGNEEETGESRPANALA